MSLLRLLASLLWPQPDTTGITEAAVYYFESVREEG